MGRGARHEWQEAYRFGVVMITAPEPVLSLVNGLRATYDPRSHAGSDAHISLTVPIPRELTETSLRELVAVTATLPTVRVRYGPPMVYPSHPGVTLRIEPQDALAAMVTALEASPPFVGASPRRWPFSAHMTLAEFIDWDASARIMEELAPRDLTGEFVCTSLSVAIPDDEFRFTERYRLPLASADERGL